MPVFCKWRTIYRFCLIFLSFIFFLFYYYFFFVSCAHAVCCVVCVREEEAVIAVRCRETRNLNVIFHAFVKARPGFGTIDHPIPQRTLCHLS